MKKIAILFFFCFLFFTISLFAQDDKIAWNNGDIQDVTTTPDEDVVWTFEIHEKEESVEIIEGKKWLRRIPDRKVEIGLFNFGLGFSNNFMTTFEIFRKKIEIDINNLSDSFNVNAERTRQNNSKTAVKTTSSAITHCAMPLQSRTPNEP